MDFDRGEGKIRALSSTIRVLGRFNLVLTPLGLLVIWLLVLQWSWPFEVISLAMATLAVFFVWRVFGGGSCWRPGRCCVGGSDDLGSCSCEDHGGSVGHATDMSAGSAHDMIRQIRAAVHEIRDISLHDPEDREAIRNRIHGNLQRAAAEQIVCAINDRRLGHARRLLTDAEAVYGESATLANLHERIKKATVRHEPLDYAHGKRLIEEYVVEGAWDEAEDLAHGLCDDHPDSDRCRQLWEDTRRARLYGHIRNCAEDHYWSEALAAAKGISGAIPGQPREQGVDGSD